MYDKMFGLTRTTPCDEYMKLTMEYGGPTEDEQPWPKKKVKPKKRKEKDIIIKWNKNKTYYAETWGEKDLWTPSW